MHGIGDPLPRGLSVRPAAVGGAERYYRRCDRAWVSRAFAASHIRPSSRSRAGLVGLEL